MKRCCLRLDPVHHVRHGAQLLEFQRQRGSRDIHAEVFGASGAEPVVHFQPGHRCFDRQHRAGEP